MCPPVLAGLVAMYSSIAFAAIEWGMFDRYWRFGE
jgi:hypothetical protein